MIRRISGNRLVAVILFLACIGCATLGNEWKKTAAIDTVEAYQGFIARYPGSSYSREARERIASRQWEIARTTDDIPSYEAFLMKHQKSKQAPAARERLKKLYALSSEEIREISERRTKKDGTAEQPGVYSRLIMAGANCLDDNARWTDPEQGRTVYNILKASDGTKVVESMRRVIVTTINRKRVLFLAVKLGIPGTQQALNNLLLAYGDKSMAEDYLNSGSRELHDGGEAWARKNGYRINTGPGSSRVRWGSF
jgi:hypothetical protein